MRLLSFACFVLILTAASTALGYEEPAYEVVRQTERYELRRYEPYLVAETVVNAGFDDSGGRGFRRLAGYIFGKNESRSQPGESEKMSMTVPVTRHHVDDDPDRTVYRFVMERAYTLDTLPLPRAQGITLKEVPGGLTAVLRYRGSISQAQFEQQRSTLVAALAEDGLEPAGPALSATYNGPWTPGFLRRNEVLVPVIEGLPAD